LDWVACFCSGNVEQVLLSYPTVQDFILFLEGHQRFLRIQRLTASTFLATLQNQLVGFDPVSLSIQVFSQGTARSSTLFGYPLPKAFGWTFVLAEKWRYRLRTNNNSRR
jgi:hypothetical protein